MRALRSKDCFSPGDGEPYSLLPFRFTILDAERYILTNLAGEYLVTDRETLHQLVLKRLSRSNPTFGDLTARHFLLDADSRISLPLLAAKYRTKQLFLTDFTSLHIFVVTLRCNNRCLYCQASRKCRDDEGYDMSREDTDRAIDFMFRSPSSRLKLEFQGGEPLLNFPLIQYIVEKVHAAAVAAQRKVDIVICSNLALLNDEMLGFCEQYGIFLSTSLDGPRNLHNLNRPSAEYDSYDRTIASIRKAVEYLGRDRVSALMTTTRASLQQPRAIIDEYIRHGFKSVFLRRLNPYGFAAKERRPLAYSVEEWLRFYRETLGYIIELNLNGIPFREDYSALMVRKMLTPHSTGFVDLQTPAGIGINVIVFNYDGDVYLSDESRMLAEMGDTRFRLGSLAADTYEEMMLSTDFLDLLQRTMNEGVPMCSDCAFLPWCGSDPVRHYRTQGDVVGCKPTSDFCKKHLGMMRHLVGLLEDDPNAAGVLRAWAY